MTMWYFPPTRRSIEQTVTSSPNGANVFRTCSGWVKTSKTSSIGASNSRVRTMSRSFGNSMTADPCRLGVTALSFLQLFEVVVHPIQSIVPHLLVLGQPLVQWPKARGFQPVQPTTSLRPAPDKSH